MPKATKMNTEGAIEESLDILMGSFHRMEHPVDRVILPGNISAAIIAKGQLFESLESIEKMLSDGRTFYLHRLYRLADSTFYLRYTTQPE